MNAKRLKAAATILAFVMTTACSEAPKTSEPKTEAKREASNPPEPVSGKSAFYEMYKPARGWASDLLPLSLASGEVPNMKNEAGKAAMWTAVFVSPSRREARTLSYLVDQGTTIHKGITVGGAEPWSGPTAKSEPFQSTQFVIDSDVAYETASHKAAAWLKNHPRKSVSFYLGNASRFPAPVWYVLWGNNKSGYSAYVNATTGAIGGK
jgi:hypothetical protein